MTSVGDGRRMTNYALRSAAIVRRSRRSTLAACTVTALLLVTGCSGNSGGGDKDGDQREVASVSSPSQKNPSQQKESPDGAASGNGRPQIRLDTTPQEALDMNQPYLACLKEHGVPV